MGWGRAMKVTIGQVMKWWRGAINERKEGDALSIRIEAWIPEEDGPELKLEIEIRNIEQEMMEIIRSLCARNEEVELQCIITEIGEAECLDSMNA